MQGFMEQYGSVIFFAVLIVAMYFILIRPQRKREKQFKDMLSTLKAGDKVVTIGGVVGTIINISDTEVTIQTADSVNLVFIRDAIARVVPDEVPQA